MSSADTEFAGSIPAAYDRYMVPMLFEPYAQDLARRAAALGPGRILEIAAGTGVVTRALVAALPDAGIVATDLNQPMLDVARQGSRRRP
jgi:ubiquinone/menaquinone biosynthesis C-methylase UbiE